METEILKHISLKDFKELGKEGLFYVRPVYVEGSIAYGLFNAAGEQVSLFADYNTAHHATWHHDINTVTVH